MVPVGAVSLSIHLVVSLQHSSSPSNSLAVDLALGPGVVATCRSSLAFLIQARYGFISPMGHLIKMLEFLSVDIA